MCLSNTAGVVGIPIWKHTEVLSRRWLLGGGSVSSYHSNHVGQGPKHFWFFFFFFPFFHSALPSFFVRERETVSVCNPGWPQNCSPPESAPWLLLIHPAGGFCYVVLAGLELTLWPRLTSDLQQSSLSFPGLGVTAVTNGRRLFI